jgi:hypothetical protein
MVVLALAGCGGTSPKKTTTGATPATPGAANTVPLSISESGTTAKFTVPASVKGGLVQLELTNKGKSLHSAQLILVSPGHTVAQALQSLGANSSKTPSWVHAEGGLGVVGPGLTTGATLNLPAGTYLVVDLGGPRTAGPPAYATFTVTPGTTGALPSTPTTVTAAFVSKDKYRWQVSGALQRGVGLVTFKSKGKATLHLIGVARLTGTATKAQIIAALKSNGAPPPFVDRTSLYTSASLDGNKSQVTPLPLLNPGKYILFCPLKDRAGGKPHFEEGLLTTVTVK